MTDLCLHTSSCTFSGRGCMLACAARFSRYSLLSSSDLVEYKKSTDRGMQAHPEITLLVAPSLLSPSLKQMKGS